MTIQESPLKKYRVKKTTNANGSCSYATEWRWRGFSSWFWQSWRFMCNHSSIERADENIAREINKDKQNYKIRTIKTEYL